MSNHHQVPTGGYTPGGAVAVGVGVGAGVPDDEFTAEMRDRQARGKDPYESSDASSDWGLEGNRKYRAGGGKDESYAVLERRRVAAQVLDSPELLMMAAQRDNESIPATRLRYTRMLCGFEEPPQPQSARKKSHRSGGSDSSRAPGGSTPSRSSRKEAR
ncbi:hypothetical protein F4815DRAFT_384459 [Daldinia loculata]|uniref:uncharacterized protein n=1 Tax=Daldinia loculata TaxID=103429 RepID=UPI0020C3E29D|nr:uncharacterized protein F4817DRAFT_345498 [Daldinia loculata]KAI1644878.1 hypothetical protein F4817DRAFT_345498 [Daldinia loculata]KAI2783213.1 hypothetical protein F4815DRAFT_384459 [Daldinia loculata]